MSKSRGAFLKIVADGGLTLTFSLSVSVCKLGPLADGVIADPPPGAFGIGDVVRMSCPEGRRLLGESMITCDPSLNFSPDPASISCSPGQRCCRLTAGGRCSVNKEGVTGQ